MFIAVAAMSPNQVADPSIDEEIDLERLPTRDNLVADDYEDPNHPYHADTLGVRSDERARKRKRKTIIFAVVWASAFLVYSYRRVRRRYENHRANDHTSNCGDH